MPKQGADLLFQLRPFPPVGLRETYGDDFCAAPENQTFKKDAYGSRPAVRFIPYEKNKNNNCEWYSKKPPSWLERILGNIDGAV